MSDNLLDILSDIYPNMPEFRLEPLEFEFKPKTEKEFMELTFNAPYNILFGFGFRKWTTYNTLIQSNVKDDFEGYPNPPTKKIKEDLSIVMFPAEWFDIIPVNFPVVMANGSFHRFCPDCSAQDSFMGCLSFGVLRKL